MTPPAYADVETSSAAYASRFSGPAGTWLLSVQSKIFLAELREVIAAATGPITLLDAGGGHGQIVRAIADAGLLTSCTVTVLGSAPECAEGLRPLTESGQCVFRCGDLLKLPFPAKSFDVVTSFRFLPHCDHWADHIRELCRVASRAVIVDYPTYQSVNLMSTVLFHLKKAIEKNTRTYTLFSHAQIAAAFESSGFRIARRTGEFFLPMVVHRVLKKPSLSAALEAPFEHAGISKAAGSPAIIRAVPRSST